MFWLTHADISSFEHLLLSRGFAELDGIFLAYFSAPVLAIFGPELIGAGSVLRHLYQIF